MTATLTATWDPTLARVVLTAAGLNAATARTEILRWEAGEPPTTQRGTVVRGGQLVLVVRALTARQFDRLAAGVMPV